MPNKTEIILIGKGFYRINSITLFRDVGQFSDKGIDAPPARVPLASGLGLDHGKFIEEIELFLAFHEESQIVLYT